MTKITFTNHHGALQGALNQATMQAQEISGLPPERIAAVVQTFLNAYRETHGLTDNRGPL